MQRFTITSLNANLVASEVQHLWEQGMLTTVNDRQLVPWGVGDKVVHVFGNGTVQFNVKPRSKAARTPGSVWVQQQQTFITDAPAAGSAPTYARP